MIRVSTEQGLRHTIEMPGLTGPVADENPSPHDYFDASLAACKSVTAMMYAQSHGYPLKAIHIDIARDASQERTGTYVLNVDVRFEGDLDEAQRTRLFDIIGRCPVHKLMTTATIDIRARLA